MALIERTIVDLVEVTDALNGTATFADGSDLELPGVSLDFIEELFSPWPGIFVFYANRDPEPGEEHVPVDTPVVVDTYSTGVYFFLSPPQVFINGVLAVDGYTFQAGFLGPGSSVIAFNVAEGFRVTIDPESDFPPNSIVTVRVLQTDPMFSYPDYDVTYTFRTAGPPLLESVTNNPLLYGPNDEDPRQCHKRVRVVFTDDMKQESATDADDALNPANYTIEPLGAPAVTLQVVDVLQVQYPPSEGADLSPRTVDLVTDMELTFGAPYRLHVSNVIDLEGLTIAPDSTLDFNAYAPVFPANRRFYVWEMLAQRNRERDRSGDLRRFTACVQEVVNLLLCKIDDWPSIFDIDTAPRDMLEAMLRDLGNPFSFPDLTILDMRRLLRTLIAIYRAKGTARGIINVVEFFLGLTITITPYSSIGWRIRRHRLGVTTRLGTGNRRALYTFLVRTAVNLTDQQRARLSAIVEYMKPAHEHWRLVEPATEDPIDHWAIGLSRLGTQTFLH